MSVIGYTILSVALFAVMILAKAVFSFREHSLARLAGPRDGLVDTNVFTQRAKRANHNMLEAMALFIPLALISICTNTLSMPTSAGAALFFLGRVAYAPLYWFGVAWLRTVAWAISIIGLVLMFTNLLPLI